MRAGRPSDPTQLPGLPGLTSVAHQFAPSCASLIELATQGRRSASSLRIQKSLDRDMPDWLTKDLTRIDDRRPGDISGPSFYQISVAALASSRRARTDRIHEQQASKDSSQTQNDSVRQSNCAGDTGTKVVRDGRLCEASPENWIVASRTLSRWTRGKLTRFHAQHLGQADTEQMSESELRQVRFQCAIA